MNGLGSAGTGYMICRIIQTEALGAGGEDEEVSVKYLSFGRGPKSMEVAPGGSESVGAWVDSLSRAPKHSGEDPLK